MSDNLLIEGKPRMGWFIDGNAETPELAVMLQDTGKQVALTVPTKGMMLHGDSYARWFSFDAQFADDPDRTRYSYAPPKVTMFHDNQGTVVLVGCRATSMRSNFSAGNGTIVANFAVLGGMNLKYGKINGLRSELPALAQWTGQRSVHPQPETDSNGRVRKVQVTLASPAETRLVPCARDSIKI